MQAESIVWDYEALIQFLYLAPVGLVQASMTGDIALINAMSAHMLMPISRDGGLTNLFTAFEPVAPQLRLMTVINDVSLQVRCDRQLKLSAQDGK